MVGGLWLGAGCSDTPAQGPRFEVTFDTTPQARSAREQAQRVELYLVDACSGVALGARPVPAIASTYAVRDATGASFGTSLPEGTFGLYGVAQDADCAVVAAGCTPVSIGTENDVLEVTLQGISGQGCALGQECSIMTGDCIDGGGGSGGVGGMGGAGGNPIERVDDGLILLYDFDEGGNGTVFDRSGVSPPLDLTIADPSHVSWGADHLTIETGTTLSTSTPASRVSSEVQRTGALTVEAWIKPSTLVAVGVAPDRIISMSESSSARNFLLGHDQGTFAARFRTEGENNGNPTVVTTDGVATTSLAHLVFTHASDGSEVVYVDGDPDATFMRAGDPSTWDESYPIYVANEGGGGREWLGELHLIALYNRALDADEVQQNFAAGP